MVASSPGRAAVGGVLMAALLAVSWRPAGADMIDESSLEPWEGCALCHSLDGVSRMPKFPKLAGQEAAYIVKQLGDFRAGRRDNDGDQMQAMAGVLAPEAVEVVARYFAQLPPPPPGARAKGAAAAAAQLLVAAGDPARAVPACLSCHAADRVAASRAPRLEAQHAAYLEKQLMDFKDGWRRNDAGGAMRKVAAALTTEEIEGLAAYLGGLERY